MHYAVPALLNRAGMLEHFYTDAVGNLGLTEILAGLVPRDLCPSSVRRLFSRRLPNELPGETVTTVQDVALFDAIGARLSRGSVWRDRAPDELRRLALAEDFRGANALYCLDSTDIDLIRAAKRRGMTVVYEQVIAPQVGNILREERTRFPGLEAQDSEKLVRDGVKLDREIWRLADLVLVPSEFVRQGMLELGASGDNIALVPYGLSESWFMPRQSQPIPGRVLFVGGVGLRKGNHYLAEACRILRSRGVDAEFRVIGRYDAHEVAAAPFVGPSYVGAVPRSDMQAEFQQADVFAFPTLAEGFALAHLEAMACGLPVVTTPNCGPAVRNGQDGFVIPPRRPDELADRLELIISDRELRNRMSGNARQRAAEFSWRCYQDRLIGAIRSLEPGRQDRRIGSDTALAA
jgi:glycosyltransferase involved in cell wall biosynthesis